MVRVQREGGRWLATTAAPFSLLLFAPLPRGRPSTEDSFRVRGEEFFRILLFLVRCECLFVSRLLFSFGRLVETWEKSGGKTRNLIFRPRRIIPLEIVSPVGKNFSLRFFVFEPRKSVYLENFFFSFRFLTRWKLIAFFKGDRERENLVFRGGRRGTFSEVSACLNLHSTRSMSPFRRRNSLPDQIRTAILEIQISIKRNITSKDLIIDI